MTKYDTAELVLMSILTYCITFISSQGHAVIVVKIYLNIDVALRCRAREGSARRSRAKPVAMCGFRPCIAGQHCR